MFSVIKSNMFLWIVIFLAIVAPSFLFGAMRVVLYIVLGFILLLFILSLIFRVRIENFRSRMEQQMKGNAAYGKDADGDVKIFTTKASSEKRVRKDVGDYVDFEEIKKD